MRIKTRSRLPPERTTASPAGPARKSGSAAGQVDAIGRGPGHSFAELPIYGDSSQPVPEPLRKQFERVTKTSLGSVRLRTGPASQRAAEALDARAFTIGRDVHLGAGEFRPGTPDGDRLLAHELTHTAQQRNSALTPQMQLDVRQEGDDAEDEADDVAEAVLEDDDELAAPAITERPPAILTQPKKQPAKTPKPKPVSFQLFKTKFNATVDASNAVTVKKAGRSGGGWTFTAAGANRVKAERRLANAEYVHASGTREALVERCTITVPAAGPASVSTIVAELGSPATLTIELSADKSAAKTKSVTVNAVAVKQLDLPGTAIKFTPADGDSIHLAMGGDAWVFSTLKQDPVPPATATTNVKGFFYVGYLTDYKGTIGTGSLSVDDAARKKAMDDLTAAPTPVARRITSDEAAMFKTVSLIESDFAGVQTYDRGILSFGFAQWTVNASLPRMLLKVDATTFERYLGRYGLSVGTPVKQLDSFVQKFVASKRSDLGVRNPPEGALFLNKKELITKALLAKATSQEKVMAGLGKLANEAKKEVDAAKPNLTSTDKAKKAAAVKATAAAKKKLDALRKQMAGLARVKAVADPGGQADLLAKVGTDGEAAAKDIVANCLSSEVMRGEEWALRFEMLGKSLGGQDAQIAEARAWWTEVSGKKVGGTTLATLLPNLRGRSALLSSYFNNPSTASGVERAVNTFKANKQKEAEAAAAAAAKAKTKVPASTGSAADWKDFPWKSGDARWTTLWTAAAIGALEALAVVEVTKGTTDTEKRRKVVKTQFP